MTFDIREYMIEQNDTRINEDAFAPDEARAISSLRAAGGSKAILSKAGPAALSQYSWSPKSGNGYAVQLVKDNRFYVVTLMPIEDGDPTGQPHQEYRGTDFKLVLRSAQQFLKRVK